MFLLAGKLGIRESISICPTQICPDFKYQDIFSYFESGKPIIISSPLISEVLI